MTDELLKKIGVMFKAGASNSRIVRDLSEDGYSRDQIQAAIDECLRTRKRDLSKRRFYTRIGCVALFLIGLGMNVYTITVYKALIFGWVGLMVFSAATFFLAVKPQGRRDS